MLIVQQKLLTTTLFYSSLVHGVLKTKSENKQRSILARSRNERSVINSDGKRYISHNKRADLPSSFFYNGKQ